MGSFIGFLIMMMVVVTEPDHMAEALKLRILWVTLLACLFRAHPEELRHPARRGGSACGVAGNRRRGG